MLLWKIVEVIIGLAAITALVLSAILFAEYMKDDPVSSSTPVIGEEYGTFQIPAPQALPYDHTFKLKKTPSSSPFVSFTASNIAGAPVMLSMRGISGKDVTVRVQTVPPLGALVNNSFLPTAFTTTVPNNHKLRFLELPNGEMAILARGTVLNNATRLGYALSNSSGGFKKFVDYFGADTSTYPWDAFVNSVDNKPMAIVFDAVTPTVSFRKCDDSNGTAFSGTNSKDTTAGSFAGGTAIVAAEDDIRLLMVDKKPMAVWLSSATDSKVYASASSDAYGTSWNSANAVFDTTGVDVVSAVDAQIVNGRLAACCVLEDGGAIYYNRASNDAGTTFGTVAVLAQTNAADCSNTAFRLVPNVRNASGTLVPALVYIGQTSLDAYVLLSTTVDGAWAGTETILPNSTLLDDSTGVIVDTIGAITDPDGNLIVVAIATDSEQFIMWKCNGAVPPAEPKLLDIGADISGAKTSPFEFTVIHGKPTLGWTDTNSTARLRWVQFDSYDCDQVINVEYFVHNM